jgi:hypothetical protein
MLIYKYRELGFWRRGRKGLLILPGKIKNCITYLIPPPKWEGRALKGKFRNMTFRCPC